MENKQSVYCGSRLQDKLITNQLQSTWKTWGYMENLDIAITIVIAISKFSILTGLEKLEQLSLSFIFNQRL